MDGAQRTLELRFGDQAELPALRFDEVAQRGRLRTFASAERPCGEQGVPRQEPALGIDERGEDSGFGQQLSGPSA